MLPNLSPGERLGMTDWSPRFLEKYHIKKNNRWTDSSFLSMMFSNSSSRKSSKAALISSGYPPPCKPARFDYWSAFGLANDRIKFDTIYYLE
jgi:hypothetical protein